MHLRPMTMEGWPDIPLDGAMIVIGRHPTCEIRLNSLRISRRHCCVMEVDGELEVKDLGSVNGIRINGHRVREGRIRPGDELSIAHIRFRLEGAGTVRPEPSPGTACFFGLAPIAPASPVPRNSVPEESSYPI